MAPQSFLDKMGITNPFLPLQRRHFFYLVGAATACLAPQSHNSSTEFGGSVFFMACRRKLRLASPPFASGSVSSAKLEGQNSIIQLLYQSLITTNLESARRPHHLQNPQNRPWYRFCNRLADRPLGGMGESGTSRMEAEWPTPSRSRVDGARRRRG